MIDRVYFSDKIRNIGSGAFYNCANLKYVQIPNGLKTIGEYAFYGSGLKSIKIPQSIERIDTRAFGDGLEEIIFDGGLKADIDPYAFDKKNIKRVIIPKGKKEEFARLGISSDKLLEKVPDEKRVIHVTKNGTLKNEFSKELLKYMKSLKVVGVLDERDIATINQMSNLAKLDLSEAFVIKSVEKQKEELMRSRIELELFSMGSYGQYRKDRDRLGYDIRSDLYDLAKKGIDKKAKEKYKADECF